MTLNSSQIEQLDEAIRAYDYPAVTYDFVNGTKVHHPDMLSVEKTIRDQLLSTDPNVVKDGLSNVLYWGYASQSGRQSGRIPIFRGKVTEGQLRDCMALFGDLSGLEPESIDAPAIKRLPEFGLAFSTKLLAFLDPQRFVVLDAQLGRLKYEAADTLFRYVRPRGDKPGGYLAASQIHTRVYRDWCRICVNVTQTHRELGVRAVDVERGIYHMVTHDRLEEAAEIVEAAE